jgi:hypothetical protein
MTDNTGKKQVKTHKGQFDKGVSGNPAGRPRGSRNKATLALQTLFEDEAELIGRKAVELAKDGDMQAIKLVLERIMPARKDMPISFEIGRLERIEDIATAMQKIMQAVAGGELTPQEAQAIATLLEQQRKNITSASLEKKIDALQNLLIKPNN